MGISEEITALRKEIEAHNRSYYGLDAPTISDFEYDALMRRLKNLEEEYPEYLTPDSPTLKIGSTAKAPRWAVAIFSSLFCVFCVVYAQRLAKKGMCILCTRVHEIR